ncbi:MAG: FadR/GntR family transcriptional regulator [Candidatus Humimicrobiaceae bacterium]
MEKLEIKPIEKLVLIDQIIDTIGRLIAGGSLKAGDILPSERELAEMLNVSRTSTRQALKALDVLGVLEIKPGERTYLNKSISKLLVNPMRFMALLHNVGIIELFETRKLIEVILVKLAADNAKEEDIKKMEILLEKAKSLLNKPKEYLNAEMEFHNAIFKASGNRILVAMMISINNLLLESRERTVMLFKKLDSTLEDHYRILEAIKNKNPDLAGEAMYDHLDLVEDTLKRDKTYKL